MNNLIGNKIKRSNEEIDIKNGKDIKENINEN